MYVKNHTAALTMKIAIFLLSGAAWILASANAGILMRLRYLVYYTNLGNFSCFLIYGFLVVSAILQIKRGSDQRKSSALLVFFKGTVIMMLTVTMLVFHFGLSMTSFAALLNHNLLTLTVNALLHYIVPVLCLLDWLLFDEKNCFKWIHPILWLFAPFLYFIFVIIRAEIGGPIPGTGLRYPYFFLDVDLLGIADVLRYVFWLVIGFVVLGYIIVLIDTLLGKIKR